jgi:cytochrome c peroxidase
MLSQLVERVAPRIAELRSGFRRPCLELVILSLVTVVADGCGTHPLHSSVSAFTAEQTVPLGLDLFASVPERNPFTRESAALGRRLFFDPLLSEDRTHTCASCHLPAVAFADSVRLPAGASGQRVSRNAPTLLNRAYGKSFFWDGRAETLEDGVLLPISNRHELALPMPELLTRLHANPRYRNLFRQAFPDLEISNVTVGYALANYIRTLRSGNAPVDRYVAGDTAALTLAARRGRAMFLGKAGCASCHSGPNFTDELFHNTGVAVGSADVGRLVVTGDTTDRGRFKTPTLREAARTAPYMHDGSIPTLERVVAFYDSGGRANPNLDSDIRPLQLSATEQADLVAFLRALTGVATP